MPKTILKQTAINMTQLKDYLAKIKKRDKELSYRANKTEEYANQFCELSVKKADELYKKLEKLKIPRLREAHFHKIIDILPKKTTGIKAVLQGFNVSITNENAKKIIDTVNNFFK